MKVIMTILGLMGVMYAVLVICCKMADEKVLMRFENLMWTNDDGRKLARMRLNDVYSVHVVEFTEDGSPYYIVHIWKDGDYYKGADYMTRDDVSELMEKLQTITD